MNLNAAVNSMMYRREQEARESKEPSLAAQLWLLDQKLLYNKVPYGRGLIGYTPSSLQNEAAALVNADREKRGVAERMSVNCQSLFILQKPRDIGGLSMDWTRDAGAFRTMLLDADLGDITPDQQAKLEEIITYAKDHP